MSRLDDIVSVLDHRDLTDEVAQLRAESAALYDRLPIKTGDRIALVSSPNFERALGWRGYEEILTAGAPGQAASVKWSRYHDAILVDFRPESEWAKGSPFGCRQGHRYLHVNEHRHIFTFLLDRVRLATEADVAPVFPGYCDAGCQERPIP